MTTNHCLERPEEMSVSAGHPENGREAATRGIDETRRFLERALVDFGLWDAFERLPVPRRAVYVRWIAAASDRSDEEDRVSRLLDALAFDAPLELLQESPA